MLRKGDPGADRPDPAKGIAEELNSEITKGDLMSQSDNAKRIFEEIQQLKASIDTLKNQSMLDSSENQADPEAVPVPAEQIIEPLNKAVEQAAKAEAAEEKEPKDELPLQESKEDSASGSAAAATAAAFEEVYRQQMEDQMEAAQRKERLRDRQKAAKAAEKERFRQEKAARNAEKREERRARAKQRQKEREIRAEVRKKKRLAKQTAEMGGGVINLHGTTISTEIQAVPNYTLKELVGIGTLEEQTEEARATASALQKVRASRYHNSAFGRRMDAFKRACEQHKTLLLTMLSIVLLVCVGTAGVFNYCTAYEYSYNGHVLGYVKNKDEVLRITDMVQQALTQDKNMQVVIDTKEDITFQRVSTLDKDIVPDTSDEVLRRLTYMGDLNVEAYGIYVNGKKAGSVRSKEVAAEVLKKIEDRYASTKKGTEIKKAEILENIDVELGNTSLRRVYSADRMADILCTSGEKESVHTVIAGETLSDIATMYGTTETRLLEDNENVDPKKLVVGSTLLIRQHAPLLTVRMTEQRTYKKTIEFETVEKKTDEMYEGEEEIQQEGSDGSEEITELTVSVNGERESRKVLEQIVKKKPVKKIVLVGTAERPPTVGDGQYIWPMNGGFTLTSHFGYRWGRLHAGIDLGCPVGNDVLAADGGTVIRAGYFGGYGYCIDIDHQNGQMTRYGHLSSILVSVGEGVYEGQHIAESGNTGASTGPHLHFEIHSGGAAHDPLIDLP